MGPTYWDSIDLNGDSIDSIDLNGDLIDSIDLNGAQEGFGGLGWKFGGLGSWLNKFLGDSKVSESH